MDGFDPYSQNVTFLAAGGREVNVTIATIDGINFETFSICISYGSQIGACFIMLVAMLIMTPPSKLRRPSNLMHMLGLILCILRLICNSIYFVSPFNEFYNFWANDFSGIAWHHFQTSLAGVVLSLLLVIVIEAALISRAWTMVTLWPPYAKVAVSFLSVAITLLTIGWKLAATVFQAKTVLYGPVPPGYKYVAQWSVITNAVSICWFCALFNAKLVLHLISNRGVLPSPKALTPMEVLVMTNGVVMIIPVLFTGLQWGHFTNFEAASLTLTSAAIILPLGSLAAQRLTRSGNNLAYCSAGSSNRGALLPDVVSWPSSFSTAVPLKPASLTSSGAGTTVVAHPPPHVSSVLSRCEAGLAARDQADLELSPVDAGRDGAAARVRVERDFEQRVDRL